MNSPSPARSITQNASDTKPTKKIAINDIELRTPPRRKVLDTRYCVRFSVGNTPRSTKPVREKKNCTSWDEKLYFDGDDDSVLLAMVFRKSRIGQDKLIGTLAHTVAEVVGRLNNGVLEVPLPSDTLEGQPDITIKFALTMEMLGDVDADELQATDVVCKATESVGMLGPTPQLVSLANSTVNSSTDVATELQTTENTWNVLLQRVALFDKIVAGIAEIHPYTALAWSVISAANKVLVNQQSRDERIIRLAAIMSDVFTFVEDATALKVVETHRKPIKLLVQQVTECGYFITEYTKQNNFWTRTAKYTFSDVDTKIADYENKLRELKKAFLDGVTLQSGVTVFRMMNVAQTIAESMDLNDMPYARGARYMEEKGCLPGTREAIIQDICDVLNSPDEDAPRVCLLTGVAGSGKSAVAHSIARLYDQQERLGSSFCFLRSDVTRRNPQNFFSTIALDLSDHDPQYKAELWRVVKNNRSLRTSASLSEQVKRLIVEPSSHLHTIGPLVVVVDALDESGDLSHRRNLLRAFSEQLMGDNLPTNLRFLITARPESDILTELAPCPRVAHMQLGDVPEHIVDEDIGRFIRHSLHQYAELESAWPDQVWCRLLVRHSQHLFQWASTACRFIEGDGAIGLNIRERLEILLQRRNDVGVHPLDDLYRTILGQLFTLDNVRYKFREVMAFVLALKEPLSLTSLSTLFDGDPNIRDIIKPLGSLLDGAHDERKPIRPLHTSFRDFLLDEARSSTFHVNILPHHSLSLGHAMLVCMRKALKFNICDLEDSRVRNDAIPDLKKRVAKAIPPCLAYSCQYWMDHVQHVECTPELLEEVTSFFKMFFPFWLEAISLLSTAYPMLYSLYGLSTCTALSHWAKNHDIATLATEASQFIQVFAPIIRESTPHLYLSAMPQTPSGSSLSQLWVNHLQNQLSVTSGHPASWPVEVHTLQGHTDHVTCVAYSPDGAHMASGSGDKTIRVFDPIAGQCVAVLPQVHTHHISSIAFSPDGCYIVSGSGDGTIRIWDVNTGQHVAGPFQGHGSGVTCVIYSPDGSYIASGSWDKTIQVWDADTGHCVTDPFQGHELNVNSLAYSPDGSQIASASNDKTLRIWDANTGKCVTGPLHGHTSSIYSVAYSPDGSHVVSGARDYTIRIWSSTTGECVIGPFQGDDSWVYSVAYSPDGNHIASASSDKTLRVWDASTGHCIGGPFHGHTGPVTSVTYSPDGNCILTGSWDKTVRIWNAKTYHCVEGTSQGHTKRINSVAYSPDGNNIVSGSFDRTIKIWSTNASQAPIGSSQSQVCPDVVSVVTYSPDGKSIILGVGNTIKIWNEATGQYVVGTAGPFQGHTNVVHSIACSPDGHHVISGAEDRTIQIWDAHTGQFVKGPLWGHTSWICSLSYSPDGRHFVSGSLDDTIRVWNAVTGECVAGPFEGHTDAVHSVAYSPDSNCIVSGSRDKTIRFWDPVTGECVGGPFLGHTDDVLSVAYSPDGNHVVSGSEDKTIRIWDASTGQCTAGPFQGHTNAVTSVAYSPDGSCIVSGSEDLSIKVWSFKALNTYKEMCFKEDGWIKLSHGSCFCWIPPWGRHALYLPTHTQVMSSYPTYRLDFSDFSYGESWVSCWK